MNTVPFVFDVTLNICSFIFFLFLIIVYFRKNARYSIKNSIFRRILYFGIFGFLFEFVYFFLIHYSIVTSLIGLAKKFSLWCFIGGLILWIYYVFIVIFEKNHDASSVIRSNHSSIDIYLLLATCTIGIVDLFLPLSYKMLDTGFVQSITGAGLVFMYIVSIILLVIPIPVILMEREEVSHKRLLSYYVISIFIIIGIVLSFRYPSLSIFGFIYTLSCYLIYYRLENPDLLYIRKYKSNNDRMRYFREQYGFLFNMSPELRDLLNEISLMKDNYLVDKKKSINKKKLETLINDFVKSSEVGETTQTNIDDDGIEILEMEEEIPEDMLVTKEIYSLQELKEVLKEDNLPKW